MWDILYTLRCACSVVCQKHRTCLILLSIFFFLGRLVNWVLMLIFFIWPPRNSIHVDCSDVHCAADGVYSLCLYRLLCLCIIQRKSVSSVGSGSCLTFFKCLSHIFAFVFEVHLLKRYCTWHGNSLVVCDLRYLADAVRQCSIFLSSLYHLALENNILWNVVLDNYFQCCIFGSSCW